MDLRHVFGSAGESSAANYLRRKGYKIIERNYSCRFGEIDIIAQKGMYIVFVEVKTRKNEEFAMAREFVTYGKQQRIIKTAMLWLQQNDSELQPRFDVVEVIGEGFGRTIRHIENAFEDFS